MKINSEGIKKSEHDVRLMYPHVSFAASTYAELGWQDYVAPVEPETPEQAAQRLERALDSFIQGEVWKRRFDSLNAARSLAGFDNTRRATATQVAAWAETCYDAALAIQAEVLGGQRAMPTEVELLAEMPALTVPAVR